jgi:hemoglobin
MTTPFDQLGGQTTIDAIVDTFYRNMDTLPEARGIRAMHHADLTEVKVVLKKYLAQWLGGPQTYSQERGHPRLRARHLPFAIGIPERDAWMLCIRSAFDEVLGSNPLSEPILEQLQKTADWMRNDAESAGGLNHVTLRQRTVS